MDKIRVIKGSLACFTFGWLALVPILGIPAALRAMALYRRVQNEMDEAHLDRIRLGTAAGHKAIPNQSLRPWNPAEKYRVLGLVLAWCGLFVSFLAIGGLVVLMLRVMGGANLADRIKS